MRQPSPLGGSVSDEVIELRHSMGYLIGIAVILVAAAFAGRGYWRLRRGVGSRHNAKVFLDRLVRYEESDARPKAVRLCGAVPRLGVSTKFALHLLGLEIPGRILADPTSSYRANARSPAFDAVLDEEVESLVADLKQYANSLALGAIAPAVVLTLVSAVALVLGLRPLGIVGGIGGVALTVDSTLQWRWLLSTVELTTRELRGCIVPIEEMSSTQKEGAAAARRLLEDTSRPARIR